MNVVILSCSTGGGHNSAAKAIQQALQARGVSCSICNALDFMPKAEAQVISKGHVFAYQKLPHVYGAAYRFEEHHTPAGLYRQCSTAGEKLYPYLMEQGFDTAICVHIFPAIMLTHILRTYFPALHTAFVATDYTCSPGVELTQLERYFIPRGLSADFIRGGISADRLVETGIPVSADCYAPPTQEEAKEQLGLDPQRRLVTLSCGSMGCGPMRSLALLLSEKLPEDTELAVLCGSNKRLKRDLAPLSHKDSVHVLGYTQEMNLWLAASSAVLSKPGGLTSTEAMTMGIPFVCINAVPGCETRNRDFFCEKGYATTARHVYGLVQQTLTLLEFPELAEEMTQKQQDFRPKAHEAIAEAVMELSGK
jgi:processive 1,2-diacylglycerol beta-glucosyltransferase